MPNAHIGDERISVVLDNATMRAMRRHQADLARYGKRPPIAQLCRQACQAYYAPDKEQR